LKIGPQLPKLLSNIKWLTFLKHGVDSVKVLRLFAARARHRETGK